MSLAPPEAFLARLVASPASGVRPASGTPATHSAAAAVATLAARGHPIVAGAGGWRLECAAVHFDPAAFERARRGAMGAALEVWERAASTNDLAHAGAAAGAPDGSVWLAEAQSQGRGRQGRRWNCEPHAGLLVSWLLRGALERPPTLLPLVIGLAACEGVHAATGLLVRTKWPNDLWLGERKVAGILVEVRAGSSAHAVVGLGLNVAVAAVPEEDSAGATALAAEGRAAPQREWLLAVILAAVERRLAEWRGGHAARLLDDWRAQDVALGRDVRVQTESGVLTGRACGVSAAGLLQLETAPGVRRELAAGEVHLL